MTHEDLNTPVPPAQTLADVSRLLAEDVALSHERRRDLASAVRRRCGAIPMPATFSSFAAGGTIWSRSSGMTDWGCRCTPSGWSGAGSSGHRRRMGSSPFPRPNWLICWTASIGATHFTRRAREERNERIDRPVFLEFRSFLTSHLGGFMIHFPYGFAPRSRPFRRHRRPEDGVDRRAGRTGFREDRTGGRTGQNFRR